MRSAGAGEAPRLLEGSGVVWIEDSRSMQCLRAGRKQEQTEEERRKGKSDAFHRQRGCKEGGK